MSSLGCISNAAANGRQTHDAGDIHWAARPSSYSECLSMTSVSDGFFFGMDTSLLQKQYYRLPPPAAAQHAIDKN